MTAGLELLAKTFNSLQTLFQIGHAGCVTEPDVIVCAESNAGHRGDLLRLQQAGAKVGGFETGLGDVREQVKGAFRINATESRNGIQFFPSESAPFIEFGQPGWKMILWTGERSYGPLLSKGSGVAGAVALNGINGFGDGLGSGAPAQPPPGHAPGFGKTVHHDGVLQVRARKAGDTLMLDPVV